jgi:hypothetical protein
MFTVVAAAVAVNCTKVAVVVAMCTLLSLLCCFGLNCIEVSAAVKLETF